MPRRGVKVDDEKVLVRFFRRLTQKQKRRLLDMAGDWARLEDSLNEEKTNCG